MKVYTIDLDSPNTIITKFANESVHLYCLSIVIVLDRYVPIPWLNISRDFAAIARIHKLFVR